MVSILVGRDWNYNVNNNIFDWLNDSFLAILQDDVDKTNSFKD